MKTLRTILSIVAAAALLAVLGGNNQITCVPAPPEEPVCAAPSDCDGLPHPALDCKAQWSCDQGSCVWDCIPDLLPGCCKSDADCQAGTVCVGDTCEMAPKPGQCWDASDCAEGQECFGVITCPCGMLCFAAPTPGTCQGGTSEGCYEDADCGFYEVCEITNDCCAPPGCEPGEPCPTVCVPCGECVQPESECWQDADCLPGYTCTLHELCPPCVYEEPFCDMACLAYGTCEPKKSECLADDECPMGYECVLEEVCPPCVYADPPCKAACWAVGTCLPLESECLADDQCPPGMVCIVEAVCPPCVDYDPPCMAPCWAVGQCVDAPGCQAVDPWSFGMCEMLLGVGFDGKQCVYVSGCGCKDQCDLLFPTMDACNEACIL
jgi:hypothetical protein